MNQKKATELRRIAHNQWVNMSPEIKKKCTVKQVYKYLKKKIKNGNI